MRRILKVEPMNCFSQGSLLIWCSSVCQNLKENQMSFPVWYGLVSPSVLLGEYSRGALKPVSKTLFFRVKSSSPLNFPPEYYNYTAAPPLHRCREPSRCFSNKQQLSGPRESRAHVSLSCSWVSRTATTAGTLRTTERIHDADCSFCCFFNPFWFSMVFFGFIQTLVSVPFSKSVN